MTKQTKILIISGIVGVGLGAYLFLKKKKPETLSAILPLPKDTAYTYSDYDWNSKGGYAHLYDNGVADYFDSKGTWVFATNTTDKYLVINGIEYAPESNDLPRQA